MDEQDVSYKAWMDWAANEDKEEKAKKMEVIASITISQRSKVFLTDDLCKMGVIALQTLKTEIDALRTCNA